MLLPYICCHPDETSCGLIWFLLLSHLKAWSIYKFELFSVLSTRLIRHLLSCCVFVCITSACTAIKYYLIKCFIWFTIVCFVCVHVINYQIFASLTFHCATWISTLLTQKVFQISHMRSLYMNLFCFLPSTSFLILRRFSCVLKELQYFLKLHYLLLNYKNVHLISFDWQQWFQCL